MDAVRYETRADKVQGLVQGEYNTVTQIYQNLHQPDFFEPNLEQFKPERFTSPKNTPDLIKVIRKNKLLVLGGSLDIDKAGIARHLALRLGETLDRESNSGDCNIPIKEWQRSSNPQSIDVELQKTETTTIFILTQVSPKDVGYDLSRIQKAASSGEREHYVVISTDTPFAGWKLPEDARKFWRELSVQELYSSEALVDILIQKLNAEESLPLALRRENFEPDCTIVGKLTLRAVAQQLKTPDKIARFVQLLGAEKKPPHEAKVLNLIELAQDNKRTLWQWYYTLLTPPEQLLALGLSFFDGLFDDQFFAAVEKVVEYVRQQRDTSLRLPDYGDLDNLRNFFSLVETEAYEKKIESRLPEQRRMFFEVAWNSHRRLIRAMLRVMPPLVQNSVRSVDLELYGTRLRREQLRRVIGEAISDIGLISTREVEDTLLQLAADRKIDVQAVAAYAMARWRDPNYGRAQEQELFRTLRRWQRETRILDLINTILNESDQEKGEGAQAYIRATVALTVSYAALYDPPNKLSKELCNLLEELLDDPSGLVRDRIGYHTLPMVVRLHLVQLRDMLHEKTRQHTYLNRSIGLSLALAYSENPKLCTEVKDTLKAWYEEGVQTRSPHRNQPLRVNERESQREELLENYREETKRHQEEMQRWRLLRTVVLTYGEIRYDEANGWREADEAFSRLRKIITQEREPFVREAVVFAVCRQIRISFEKNALQRQYFQKLQSHFQDLVSEFTEDECNEIVKVLTNIYLEQRKNLKGGDDSIEVEGKYYPIWILESERPPTPIEEAMQCWIKKPNNPVAAQIALRADAEFTRKLEQKEKSFGKTKIDEISHFLENFGNLAERKTSELVGINPLLLWFVTLHEGRHRRIIRYLLPEALKQNNSSPETMNFVLEKWRSGSDKDIQTISDLLKRGLFLAKHRGWLIALGGGILLTLIIWIGAANTGKSSPIPTSQPTFTPNAASDGR